MKKLMTLFLFLLFMSSILNFKNLMPVYATTENEEDLEELLSESINLQLESLDLEPIEDIYNKYVTHEEASFYDILTDILNGENVFSFNSVLNLLCGGIVNTIKSNYKLLLTILAIAFLSALISNFAISKTSSDFLSSISFVFVAIVAGLISYSVLELITDTSLTLSNINKLTETISPILLALMVSIGAVSSSALYQPAISAMSTIIIDIFTNFLFGLIVFMLVITILGSLVDGFNLGRLNQFCSSLFKWVISIVFTLFIGYLSLQGVTASGYDGLSIKTAKYAIRSYIPIVGGYLSDGFEIFRGGSILIKNSLGFIGVIILIFVILSPLVKLIALNLTFKLASSFTEIVGAKKISNLLSGVTKIFSYLIAIIFAVFMMCFILFILIIMTANVV